MFPQKRENRNINAELVNIISLEFLEGEDRSPRLDWVPADIRSISYHKTNTSFSAVLSFDYTSCVRPETEKSQTTSYLMNTVLPLLSIVSSA